MDSLQNPILAIPVSYLVTTLLLAGARFVISKEPPTLKRMIQTIVISFAVVFGTYLYLEEKFKDQHGLLNLIVAFLSFFAKDILEFGIAFWEKVKQEPLEVIKDLLRTWLNKGGDK